MSQRRDPAAPRRFFQAALACAGRPVEVTTDRAPVYPTVLDELLAGTFHNFETYANNRVAADHGRLKARLRPIRSLKVDRNAEVIAAGHALVQNLRRGHHELGMGAIAKHWLEVAFDELTLAI